jgi:hypothetical protein
MRTSLTLFLVVLIVSFSFGQAKSFKQGVGYGYHSAADMNTASEGVSWWFNWAAQPDVAIRTTYSEYNVDFAPQAWNAAGIAGVNTWVMQDDKIKYLLGFNEPNFKAQANMTPTQAAAAWPQLQAIADQYNLKLVSPAVNYCGECVSENGIIYYNPFDWLDDFFTACVGCRVDYIALHWYGGGNSMTGYINDARKYGKPIWVTEYANWEAGVTAQGQKNYLAGTTNFLERDPDVYRYSWFIGRGAGANVYPYIDLYGASGQMTPLGQLYLDIPVYDSSFVNEVPGRIEAEEYYKQSGIFGELTNDADGFMNIGYTDSGDWMNYKISVAESGEHQLTTRYAGTAAGKFDVYIDDVKETTVNTANTGGWQSWASVTNSVNLEAGEHIMKLVVVTMGFNLNWLSFAKGAAGIYDSGLQPIKADVYPNPIIDNKFKIIFQSYGPGGITVQINDLNGKTIFTEKIEKAEGKEIGIDLGNVTELSKGIYILSLRSKDGYMNKKIALF